MSAWNVSEGAPSVMSTRGIDCFTIAIPLTNFLSLLYIHGSHDSSTDSGGRKVHELLEWGLAGLTKKQTWKWQSRLSTWRMCKFFTLNTRKSPFLVVPYIMPIYSSLF